MAKGQTLGRVHHGPLRARFRRRMPLLDARGDRDRGGWGVRSGHDPGS